MFHPERNCRCCVMTTESNLHKSWEKDKGGDQQTSHQRGELVRDVGMC